MRNFNFRQEWHDLIVLLPQDIQIEVYNALFAFAASGQLPEGLSDEAAELIERNIAPVLRQRSRAAERRRRLKEKAAQQATKDDNDDISNPSALSDHASSAEDVELAISHLNRAQRRCLERLRRKRKFANVDIIDCINAIESSPSLSSKIIHPKLAPKIKFS